MKREGEIRIHNSSVHFWEEHVPQGAFTTMNLALCKVVNMLRRGGWKVHHAHAHLPEGSSIERYHWAGKKGDLEFHAGASGRHFEIEFYQNVAFENPNGGRYDFAKLRQMARVSPALRLQCLAEMWRVLCVGAAIGYVLCEKDGFRTRALEPSLALFRDLAERGASRGTPLDQFNRGWGSDRFDRDETGWPSPKEISSCWRQHDRQGNQITQGVTKHLRVNGRLARGQVFGGINGNWELVSNGREIAWSRHAQEFFDCEHPELEPRRAFPDQAARLEKELAKAVEAKNYRRVAAIGAVLDRLGRKAA
jgi:hypothetical protein